MHIAGLHQVQERSVNACLENQEQKRLDVALYILRYILALYLCFIQSL
jgi:hypothetical protein